MIMYGLIAEHQRAKPSKSKVTASKMATQTQTYTLSPADSDYPSYLNSAYIHSRVSSISSQPSTRSGDSSLPSHYPYNDTSSIAPLIRDGDDSSIYPSSLYPADETEFSRPGTPPQAMSSSPDIPQRSPLRDVRDGRAIMVETSVQISRESISTLRARVQQRLAEEKPIVVRVQVRDDQAKKNSIASLRRSSDAQLKTKYITLPMPRKDYFQYFAVDEEGVYRGSEPYRLWAKSEIEAVYKEFKPADFGKRRNSAEKSKGFLASVNKNSGDYFIPS